MPSKVCEFPLPKSKLPIGPPRDIYSYTPVGFFFGNGVLKYTSLNIKRNRYLYTYGAPFACLD